MIIITEEEFKQRIVNKFGNEQPFEILEYTRMTKPIKLKCLKCGTIKSYSSAANFLGAKRVGICHCYNENSKLTKHDNNKKEILDIIDKNNLDFRNFGYSQSLKKYTVSVLCNNCSQEYTKTWCGFLKDYSCPYCGNKQKMNTQAFSSLLPKEYTLLSEYKGQDENIIVKHECGFIWKRKAHSLISSIGCPKCNKKKSKGERKIEKILDDKKIVYSTEYSFDWQSNKKRRYDFYLPEYNLVIEYMGEQHYKESSLFKISLSEQKEIDETKAKEAIKNNIRYASISYKGYYNLENIIDTILNSTTSLYDVGSSESKQQNSQVE